MRSSNRFSFPLVALICFLLLGRGLAEQNSPNPFAPPPPPSGNQPSEGSDFDEDSEALPPPNAFGFGNPGEEPPPPPPPPSASAPEENVPFFPPSARPPVRVSSPTPSKPAQRSAPKLADYLELDASVKGSEVRSFDLQDKEIKDIVLLISKWTGKNFILDNKVRGKISIVGPSQVTLQEAYQAFLSALEANGLTTVQSGKFIRVIETAEARRAPVKTYSGDFAPKDDQFITRIFQLKYINADEVERQFRDMVTRQGKLFAYEPTNSIIITDTGSNIYRIKEILETLDVKSFETTLHVLKIVNSSSKNISEMLSEIYGDDKSRSGPGGQARTFRRSALERTRGGGIISKIIPDEQTNSLIVLANQAGFESLKKLVDKLDVRITDTGRIHVYYCEYAKAEDLSETLASLASGSTGASTKRKAGTTTPGAPAGGAGGPVTAELEGGVKVTADKATNSLVITAGSADFKTLRRVIKKLDIPRQQVFIETAVMEVSVDNQDKWNTNMAVGVPGRAFGGGVITSPDVLQNLLTNTPTGGATVPVFAGPSFGAEVTGPTGTKVPITVNTFMGIINFITTNSNTSILSTPQVIALDNEKAEFKVQEEIPVFSGFPSLAAGSASTAPINATIENKKVGIEIKLTPHVNAKSRHVRLEIEQKVDTINNRNVPEQLSKVQVATITRVTNTQVVVKDKDFVMLGGLMSDQTDEVTSKIPLLGDIPILGWLFKSKKWQVFKKNLVLLLHPRIIGTTLESASLISEKLQHRDKTVNEVFSGDEKHKDEMNNIKSKIDDQTKRGGGEKPFEYKDEED